MVIIVNVGAFTGDWAEIVDFIDGGGRSTTECLGGVGLVEWCFLCGVHTRDACFDGTCSLGGHINLIAYFGYLVLLQLSIVSGSDAA